MSVVEADLFVAAALVVLRCDRKTAGSDYPERVRQAQPMGPGTEETQHLQTSLEAKP